MVHLSKLAVGIRDPAHLAAVQAQRAREPAGLVHRTRRAPRRAEELLDGGSIYWVIAGTMLVRQHVQGIDAAARPDGSPCVALRLAPTLTPVAPRAVRAFQGWRYLEHTDVPADLAALNQAQGEADLPEALRQALRLLALL